MIFAFFVPAYLALGIAGVIWGVGIEQTGCCLPKLLCGEPGRSIDSLAFSRQYVIPDHPVTRATGVCIFRNTTPSLFGCPASMRDGPSGPTWNTSCVADDIQECTDDNVRNVVIAGAAFLLAMIVPGVLSAVYRDKSLAIFAIIAIIMGIISFGLTATAIDHADFNVFVPRRSKPSYTYQMGGCDLFTSPNVTQQERHMWRVRYFNADGRADWLSWEKGQAVPILQLVVGVLATAVGCAVMIIIAAKR